MTRLCLDRLSTFSTEFGTRRQWLTTLRTEPAALCGHVDVDSFTPALSWCSAAAFEWCSTLRTCCGIGSSRTAIWALALVLGRIDICNDRGNDLFLLELKLHVPTRFELDYQFTTALSCLTDCHKRKGDGFRVSVLVLVVIGIHSP